MLYDAVIFDLDGTLLDTLGDIADSLNALLVHEGRQPLSKDEVKAIIGHGVTNLVRGGFPDDNKDEEVMEARVNYYRAEYSRRLDNTTRLYEGIAFMLDNMTRAGVKMAILSNKNDTFTKIVAEKYLSRWPFKVIMGETPERPIKPDPASALEIAAAMGADPARTAFVGDSETDMKTAVAAGMLPIGVLWGFRGKEELLQSGAKILVERPGGILSVLG